LGCGAAFSLDVEMHQCHGKILSDDYVERLPNALEY